MYRPCLVLALAALAACGPNVQVDRDLSVPIPRAATYAWRNVEFTGLAPQTMDSAPVIRQRLRTAIDAELALKGYRLISDSNVATLLVHYHVGVAPKTELTQGYNPGHRGLVPVIRCRDDRCWRVWVWGWYGPPEVTIWQTEYREGTLVVDLEDRRTQKLAWRGVGTDRVDETSGSPATIARGVRAILKKLPAVE